ncbi:hypothetical protein NSERUTF1_3763 [Nocardia seriolae]|nr:hypothetical protein NSERUTF1_3763 [Nocardia seriolae]
MVTGVAELDAPVGRSGTTMDGRPASAGPWPRWKRSTAAANSGSGRVNSSRSGPRTPSWHSSPAPARMVRPMGVYSAGMVRWRATFDRLGSVVRRTCLRSQGVVRWISRCVNRSRIGAIRAIRAAMSNSRSGRTNPCLRSAASRSASVPLSAASPISPDRAGNRAGNGVHAPKSSTPRRPSRSTRKLPGCGSV